MGVLRCLFEAASPFLLVAEIELSLRTLIELALDPEELGCFAKASLTHYKPENIPAKLEEMTFHDYVLLIGHGDNWPRFNRVFRAERSMTRAKLKLINDLRNNLFHFRQGFADRDWETLTESREWMLRLVDFAGGQETWK